MSMKPKTKSQKPVRKNVPLDIKDHPVKNEFVAGKEVISEPEEIQKVVTPKKQLPKELEDYKWKAGQTGNPSGRPKDTLKALGMRIAQLKAGKVLKPKEQKYLQDLGLDTADMSVITFIMAQLATSRDPAKISMFLERVYGKVPNININAEISTALVTRFRSKFTDAELERIVSGEEALEILLDKIPDVADVQPQDEVVDAEEDEG